MCNRSAKKCIVKNCLNRQGEGLFVGDLCGPCYSFAVTGRPNNSFLYKNAHIDIMDITFTALAEPL